MAARAKFLAVHSFRAGAGRSSLIASFAILLAAAGKRVAVIDTCLRNGNLGALFGFDAESVPCSFHSAHFDHCALWQAAYEVTARAGAPLSGRIYLVPAKPTDGQFEQIRRDGYDPDRLSDALTELVARLRLDSVLFDLDFGIDISTMSLFVLTDALLVLMRHDKREYQGTAVIVELARQLAVPEIFILLNEAPPSFDSVALEQRVAELYGCPLAGILPYAEEMAALERDAIFAVRQPEHPNVQVMRAVLSLLLAAQPSE